MYDLEWTAEAIGVEQSVYQQEMGFNRHGV